MRIDLNADVGESYGAWTMGADALLMPSITSANVACGAHAGDPLTMARTVALALEHGVVIGAHPGYPDRDGFGRRELPMEPDELEASLVAQLGAFSAICRAQGAQLTHVKPHGALYHRAARDSDLAAIIAQAIALVSGELVLVGLVGSAMLEAGRAAGLTVASEAFADRTYEADGTLRSRRLPGALVTDPTHAASQALSIARDGRVTLDDGSTIEVRADTICIHGDTPDAPLIAASVRQALEDAGIEVLALATRRL